MAISVLSNIDMKNNSIQNVTLDNVIAQRMTLGKTIYLKATDDLQDIIDANTNVILDCTLLSATNFSAPYIITNKSIIFKSLILSNDTGYVFATNLFTITNSNVVFLDCEFVLDGVDCTNNSSALISATNNSGNEKQIIFNNTLIRLSHLKNNPDICALDLQNVILSFQHSRLEASTSDDIFANTINAIKFDAQLTNSFSDRMEIKFSELSVYTNDNTDCANATVIYFKDTAQDIYPIIHYSTISINLESTSARAIYIPNDKHIKVCECSQIGAVVIAKESESNFVTWTTNTSYQIGDKVKITDSGNTYYIQCKVAHTSGTTFFNGTEWTYWDRYYVMYVGNCYLSSILPRSTADYLIISAQETLNLANVTIQDTFNCYTDNWNIKYNKEGFTTNGTVKGALDTLFTTNQANLTRYNYTLPANTLQFDTAMDLFSSNILLIYLNGVLLTADSDTVLNDYWVENNTILNFRTSYDKDSTLIIIK